jgi:hypothetical protein
VLAIVLEAPALILARAHSSKQACDLKTLGR